MISSIKEGEEIASVEPIKGFLLEDFIGQKKIISDIKNRIDDSIKVKHNLPNLMFCAPPEMGKTLLAEAIAKAMNVHSRVLPKSGRSKLREVDIASLLTNLNGNDILVVPEVEDLSFDNFLWTSIETGTMEVLLGKGPGARRIEMQLPKFSVIATTSKPWKIDERIRRWFVIYDFEPYSEEELQNILMSAAKKQRFAFDIDVAIQLAKYCKGSSGNAEVIAKRLSPYISTINDSGKISAKNLPKVFSILGFGEYYPKSLSVAEKFSSMSGQDFEHWTAAYFRSEGYQVELTKVTGDHGIDLMLYKNSTLAAIVQCKCWNDPVGEPVIRDFYGSLISSKAPEGFVFATSSYTPQALLFAQGKPIKLIGLDELVNLKTL